MTQLIKCILLFQMVTITRSQTWQSKSSTVHRILMMQTFVIILQI